MGKGRFSDTGTIRLPNGERVSVPTVYIVNHRVRGKRDFTVFPFRFTVVPKRRQAPVWVRTELVTLVGKASFEP
jgi:hypothetical protein